MAKELLESKFFNIVEIIKNKIEQKTKLEDLLTYICEQLVLSLECPGVWIGMKEDEGRVKSIAKAGELTPYLDEIEVRWDDTPLGGGAVGQAIKSSKIQFLEVGENERLLPWIPVVKKLNINTLLSIPIIGKGNEAVGALTICSQDVNGFSEASVAVLNAFAVQISLIIDSERTRDLLDKYRLLLENTKDIVLLVEPEGRIVEANQAATKIYGYTREELLALNILDLSTEIEQKVRQQTGVTNEKGIVFETIHRKKDSTIFPVEISSIVEMINGRKQIICIIRDISKRKNFESKYHINKKEMGAKVSYLTTHDILTELPNRTVFTKKLKEKLDQEQKDLFAVFIVDIDRFKFINDNYGHDIGDILLTKVAGRIKRLLNKEDIICRYGGDEFVILVNSRQTPVKTFKIASQIINRCCERFLIRGHELYVSLSMGIAIYPDNGKDVDSLIKHADIAVCSAKKTGGNGFRVYVSEEDAQLFKNFSLLGNLNNALKKNEFTLYYQPQLELATGKIIGVEALIRWLSPTGLISPGDFIPLAEDTGLIIPVGEWVMKTACDQNKRWQDNGRGRKDLKMSVNISAKQFYQENFVSTILEILADTKLEPELLNIEITESIPMKDFQAASRIIADLKKLGISITIDDFGTGYSSLNYLANLDLDYLKIDRSLIENLHIHTKKNSVVKGIINIAHNLGIMVIAEGVETKEELDFLKEHKCDFVQGFLIGHPLPVQQNLDGLIIFP